MKTNIIMSFRPFEDEYGIIQDLALWTWTQQLDCRLIIIDGGESGVVERCQKYGLQRIDDVETGQENGYNTPRFMACDFWRKCHAALDKDCKNVVYANADIVLMHQGITSLLGHCTDVAGDTWGAFFRRINIVNWKDYIVESDYDLSIKNLWSVIWELGSTNLPGMGDVTCWSYKGFEKFIELQPDVPWDLLGMDRVWLDMHFKCGYPLFELTFTFPTVHPYHIFSTKQVPDEAYASVFNRKVWPELWKDKTQHVTAYECGLILVDWCDKKESRDKHEKKLVQVGGNSNGD